VIRFCANPSCGRGFIALTDKPDSLCPTCRHHIGEEPLSKLVGGKPREPEPKRKRG
jgi:hypothetical protein